jgi:hypothetical protein
MITGLSGLVIGYALMIFAPGNFVRLSDQIKAHPWLTWETIAGHAALLFLILVYFHIIPWYFNLRSLYILYGKNKENAKLAQEVFLVKIMCVLSFCMTFMMLFSPNFQTRSVFPGTVLLITATSILSRVQDEYLINLIKKSTKKFLCFIGIIYFVITTASAFYGSYHYSEQINKLIAFVKSSDYAKHNVIEVNSLCPVHDVISSSSHFHLINSTLSSNENAWSNVAFSRYYGIKGIRMVAK